MSGRASGLTAPPRVTSGIHYSNAARLGTRDQGPGRRGPTAPAPGRHRRAPRAGARALSEQLQVDGPLNGFLARVHAEFLVDRPEMGLHRVAGDVERVSDL